MAISTHIYEKLMIPRRSLLRFCTAGIGQLALADLLLRSGSGEMPELGENSDPKSIGSPLQAKVPHFPARAKRVICLFMHGGPSQVDTFDYKPELLARDGEPLPFEKPRIQFSQTGNLLRSPWKFSQHGQCGAYVSELFPQIATCVDDITFYQIDVRLERSPWGRHAEDAYRF
jgi:hypothetical protein